MFLRVFPVLCSLITFKTPLNGPAHLEVIAELPILISVLVEQRLEVLLEKKKLEVAEKVVLMPGNNI